MLELDVENLILEGGILEVSGEGKTIVRKSATLKNTSLNLSQTALEGSQVFSVEVKENVEFKVDNSSVQLNQSEIQVEQEVRWNLTIVPSSGRDSYQNLGQEA